MGTLVGTLDTPETMEILSKATAFLVKLWRILAEPTFSHAIHWTGDQEFIIPDIRALERDVLPHYFRSTQYSSFQRQLNYFSFSKVGKMSYAHPHFDRTNPSAVMLIKRKTNTGNITKKRKAAVLKEQDQQIEMIEMPLQLMQRASPKKMCVGDQIAKEVPRPRIASPVATSDTTFAVKARTKTLTPKPRTPMTPFYACLKMCDRLVAAHPETDFATKTNKDVNKGVNKDAVGTTLAATAHMSFPYLNGADDLAEFEKGLDWACGLSDDPAILSLVA